MTQKSDFLPVGLAVNNGAFTSKPIGGFGVCPADDTEVICTSYFTFVIFNSEKSALVLDLKCKKIKTN